MKELSARQLFHRLAEIDQQLPYVTSSIAVVCSDCSCGLRDSINRKELIKRLPDIYKEKHDICDDAVKKSIRYLLNHPTIKIISNNLKSSAINKEKDKQVAF